MMGRTHRIVSGSSAFLAVAVAGAPPVLAAAAGGVAALSASWPDVDQKVKFLPHRGPTHWPALQASIFSVPVLAALAWLPVAVLYVGALCGAAFFGCLMHSVADAMTVERHGIKLLWPISGRGYHVLPRRMRVRVANDSRSERVFVYVWCIIVVCLVYVRFRQQIPA